MRDAAERGHPVPAPLRPPCARPAPFPLPLLPPPLPPPLHRCAIAPLHRCTAAPLGVQAAQLAMGRLAVRSDESELWLRRAASQGYIDAEAARGTHRSVQRPLLQKLRRLAEGTGYETQYVDLGV